MRRATTTAVDNRQDANNAANNFGASASRHALHDSFAQLLQEAAAPADEVTSTTRTASTVVELLPALPEEEGEEEVSRSSSFVSARAFGSSQVPMHPTNHTAANNSSSSCYYDGLCQTIIPAGGDDRQNERRLARLAGATARQTGPDAFSVEIEVSRADNDNATAVRLLDILQRPEYLSQWCDALPDDASVLTTRTVGTEGGGTAAGSGDRYHHEAQWITATSTATLRPPSSYSCWYGLQAAVGRALGFPTYASVKIFAEPVRQAVSVSLGPFPGGVTAEYRFQITAVSAHKLRVVNQVRLQRNNNSESSWSFSSPWLLPTTADYMDQTLGSMARLRFLVEQRHSGMTSHSASPLLNDLAQPLLSFS